MALRLVVADDNFLVREGLAALLAEIEEIDVVAMATDTATLIRSVGETAPDAVLTDIRMPPTYTNEGIGAAKQIRAEHPGVGVVVLSQYVEEDYAFELLVDGVTGLGYLLKERVTDVDELVRALHEVSRGGSVLDPKVVEALVARKGAGDGPLPGLTAREREVLEAMVALLRPVAISWRTSRSRSVRPRSGPSVAPLRATSASTTFGSSTDPPRITSCRARTSSSRSVTRSLSR